MVTQIFLHFDRLKYFSTFLRITVIFIELQWKMGLIYADQIIFGADARVGLLERPLWYLMDECGKNYSAQ